jgi:hypothetical protein
MTEENRNWRGYGKRTENHLTAEESRAADNQVDGCTICAFFLKAILVALGTIASVLVCTT